MPEVLDLPAVAGALGRTLHDAGIPSTPEHAARFARAVALAPPADRDRLYWTARAVFVSHRDQVPRFDAVFARLFDGLADPAEARGDPNAPPLQGAEAGERRATPDAAPLGGPSTGGALPHAGLRDGADRDDPERDVPVAAASAEERLRDRDFAELDDEELRALRRLMRELALAPPPRITRRRQARPAGRPPRRARDAAREPPDRWGPGAPHHAPPHARAAPARGAVRRVRVDGALHARVPALPARRGRRSATPRPSCSRPA